MRELSPHPSHAGRGRIDCEMKTMYIDIMQRWHDLHVRTFPSASCPVINHHSIHSFIISFIHRCHILCSEFKRSTTTNKSAFSRKILLHWRRDHPAMEHALGREKEIYIERVLEPKSTRPICAAPNFYGILDTLGTLVSLNPLNPLATTDTSNILDRDWAHGSLFPLWVRVIFVSILPNHLVYSL